jgi:FtsH-binding integral membrane protein
MHSVELVITFSFCLVAQYSENYRNFQLDNPWVIIMAFVFLIATMIVAFCAKKARTFPLDMVLLLVFILSFSYIISLACSAVVDSTEDNTLVPVTIAATIGITAALTIYAFVCKGHYILWIGILLVCCAAAFTLGIASIFVYMPLLYVLICVLGLVIYGIYLVIITKMIIGNELGGFPLDSPIIASVFLYIYIMRIFIYLLALFSKK